MAMLNNQRVGWRSFLSAGFEKGDCFHGLDHVMLKKDGWLDAIFFRQLIGSNISTIQNKYIEYAIDFQE